MFKVDVLARTSILHDFTVSSLKLYLSSIGLRWPAGGAPACMVRLLMKWDIKMGREQPYFEFVMREFAPGLMQLGIEPAEVWYTIYGDGPQMLTIGEVSSPEKLQRIVQSSGWKKLQAKLLLYVTNYSQRIVDDNNRAFQL